MGIAMLSPIAWRIPPHHCGPWESVVSLLNEGLVVRRFDVILFVTVDSHTEGKLHAVHNRGYGEDNTVNPKVWECLQNVTSIPVAHIVIIFWLIYKRNTPVLSPLESKLL